jgi:armadillo repeat-containing protein 8
MKAGVNAHLDVEVFLEQGLMPRIVQLLNYGDPAMRVSALWAVKNLVHRSTAEITRNVMDHLGWRSLARCSPV